MLGLGAVPGILLAIGMFYLPESPRWLLKSGRETEAANVLKRVRGSADVIAEIADIKADLKLERDTIGWRQLLGPTFRRPMLLGVGLAIFQQITGINTVIYYAPTIFQSAGYRSATAAILATAGVGVVNVAFTILALKIIDGDDHIDLLFTDVMLPGGMNGRQLATEAVKRRPGLKVLYTSGYTENALVHHGRLDPDVLLLPKPYLSSDLARMLRTALAS